MLTTVLFDLDGTLLPMELDTYLEAYFELLTRKLSVHGYDPEAVTNGMWEGVNAMIANNGSLTNEAVFWSAFSRGVGRDARLDMQLFEEFYENEFQTLSSVCGHDPRAAEVIAAVKARGLRVVLATNPLYPAIATRNRIRWAGLQPEDFEIYTTFEDTYHCKPNPAYFQDILDKLSLKPDECLMVGNDAIEDLAAAKLGIPVFLMTKYLINRKNSDISAYPQGDFDDLLEHIDNLQ